MIKHLLSALAAFSVFLAPAAFADPMLVTPLTIVSGETEHAFTVEVADDDEETSYGLMNRESLDADKGMLFDFGQPREPAMYMKNTLIPLDMLFVDTEGRVEMIAHNAVPGSLRTISPGVPVKGVLEIQGGLAKTLGLNAGDTIVHPIFGNAAETD